MNTLLVFRVRYIISYDVAHFRERRASSDLVVERGMSKDRKTKNSREGLPRNSMRGKKVVTKVWRRVATEGERKEG